MHISEGILSAPLLAAGWAATAGGLAAGLKRMNAEKIPETALLTAAFFVASLIHVPIGPSNAHLALNGLAGILLGWSAFPAIFTALMLQAVLFQFGGITTLGVNTFNMAMPAVAAGYIAAPFLRSGRKSIAVACSGITGAMSLLASAFLVALTLALAGESFSSIAGMIFIAHLPVAAIEGVVTGGAVSFILKTKPDLLKRRA